ncbi:hypothetical protein MJO29_009821 [Puccinia striiformis f. sp. tritici]|nr:hypothetical protein MJO29_009821 [Puccinia striiformis f. sp. tritici]
MKESMNTKDIRLRMEDETIFERKSPARKQKRGLIGIETKTRKLKTIFSCEDESPKELVKGERMDEWMIIIPIDEA